MDDIGSELRVAVRALWRAPTFTAAAVLTLAIGIGVNTAVFSVVNAVLFRPLPVEDASRIVVLATTRGASALAPLSFPDLEDYRAATPDAFDDIAGYSVGFMGLDLGGGAASRVLVTWVTGNYSSLLGIRPARGRLIARDEGRPGGEGEAVVIGYRTWQQRFGGDPSIVGSSARFTPSIRGYRCTMRNP